MPLFNRRPVAPPPPPEPEAEPEPILQSRGVCPVCDEETVFKAYDPWLRDHFACTKCWCQPRERALVTVLEMVRPDWRTGRIHESSPSSRGSLKFRRESQHYTASQYDPSVAGGEMSPDGSYRSEDLQAQSFADDSFDIVITQDVFEHLFRPDLAIAEIARTLKPGGVHICTVPLVCRDQPSRRRAIQEGDGTIVHLQEASYHYNPVSPEGSLVTIDWGFDIAPYFQAHGGLTTTIFHLDDLSRGIRAELNEVIVARKLPVAAV